MLQVVDNRRTCSLLATRDHLTALLPIRLGMVRSKRSERERRNLHKMHIFACGLIISIYKRIMTTIIVVLRNNFTKTEEFFFSRSILFVFEIQMVLAASTTLHLNKTKTFPSPNKARLMKQKHFFFFFSFPFL